MKFDITVNGSWTKNNLDDLGVDENGVADPEFTGGFDATQIFKHGLPLGAYYVERHHVVQRREQRRPDRLPGRPGRGRTASSRVADDPAIPRHAVPEGRRSTSRPSLLGRVRAGDRDVRPPRRAEALQPHRRVPQRDLRQRRRRAASRRRATSRSRPPHRRRRQRTSLGGFIEDASFTKLREVALSLYAAAAVRRASRRRLGRR